MQKTEPWESDKEESDMECFFWEKSRSEHAMADFVRRLRQALGDKEQTGKFVNLQRLAEEPSDEEVKSVPEVKDYAEAVCEIHNGGESDYAWEKYGQAVRALLGLGDQREPLSGEVYS